MREWYEKKIGKICNGGVDYNYDKHIRAKKLIEKYEKEFKEYEFSESSEECLEKTTEPLIFLSHNSNDKAYGNLLEQFMRELGIKDNQLIYTSHPLHKIPLDANIYDFLRENIHRNIFMIFLWSNNYLDSPACMNEMGAAWVAQCDYTNIYVPSFSFENPRYHQCAVDTNKMGTVLNGDAHCKQCMIQLKNKICNMFKLNVSEERTTYLLDKFIKNLKEVKSDGQNENGKP